jgi:hypothetical protein
MFYRNRIITERETKWIMTSSAFVMLAHGIVLLFAPEFLLKFLGLSFSADTLIGIQLFGATLIGFGNMNWVGRNSVLGGIYGRAIVTGNFTHTVIGFLTSIRIRLNGFGNVYFGIEVLLYFIFATAFTMMLYGNPGKRTTTD